MSDRGIGRWKKLTDEVVSQVPLVESIVPILG
jgi:hypothetical protein